MSGMLVCHQGFELRDGDNPETMYDQLVQQRSVGGCELNEAPGNGSYGKLVSMQSHLSNPEGRKCVRESR